MSRGQRPRTPDEFPRMKHRAAGRQMRNRQRILKHFLAASGDAVSVYEAWGEVLNRFVTEVAQPIVDRIRESFRQAFLGNDSQSDYALVPAPTEGASTHVGPVGIDVGGVTAPIVRSTLDRQRELHERWLEQHPEPLAAPPRIDR